MALTQGVAAFVEFEKTVVSSTVWQLIAEGNKLANKLNTKFYVIALGYEISNVIATSKICSNTIELILVDDFRLKEYDEDLYLYILEQILLEISPEILLFAATFRGKSLAARIATRFQTGLTSDCTELDISENERLLIQRRPAISGQVLAEILCPVRRPQIATLHTKPEYNKPVFYQGNTKIILPKLKWKDTTRYITENQKLFYKPDRSEEIIIGVGNGIKNRENLQLIYQLANKLRARIGATKAIIDKGWLDYEYQIGQTGRSISASVYIACGISGAVHHMIGISSVKKIIAINLDKNAPIFNIADYGIIGDLFQIIPLIDDYLDKKAGDGFESL